MKQFYFVALLLAMHAQSFSQLNNGGLNANFGVDADTKAGYLKYGPSTGTVSSDDWFSSSTASGNNVIDTSNASYYKSLLQAGNNICFSKGMSVPYYTTINGKLWLDALYARDYIVTATSVDTTTFSGGKKNGDDPASWSGVASSIPDKTDLIDAFAHMRRNGNSTTDSLWIFTGVSTMGVVGSRYFDIELYKNRVAYNKTAGTFNTAGPDAGHVQWQFDASGNITQTGDMIIAVSYTSGVPTVEVRIWVSKTTYNTVTPSLFKFGSSFDGTTSFGYASILSKTGTTDFGSGITNLSATPATDTTYATPWGSHGIISGTQWETQYQSLQFIEIGLNLTRMGIDPELYQLNSGNCQAPFASLFFKSRSSHSFTSNLQDFAGPYDFLKPASNYTITTPTLSCRNTTGTISVQNNSGNYFTWSTSNGNITSTSTNSIQVNKAGTYTLQASLAQGCPVLRTDVITVATDTFAPVASFYTTSPAVNQLLLHGGDTTASNYSTPFGGSQGLSWNWNGPNSFTSSVQDPVTSSVSGTYQLIVTETRNGCADTISHDISFALLSTNIVLKAEPVNNSIILQWNMKDSKRVTAFDIERSSNGASFEKIGSVTVASTNTNTAFSFTDKDVPTSKNIVYRIKIITAGEPAYFSTIASVTKAAGQSCMLAGTNPATNPRLIVNTKETVISTVVVYNSAGQTMYTKQMVLQAGQNNIELPVGGHKDKLHIVSLYINNRLEFSGKAIL